MMLKKILIPTTIIALVLLGVFSPWDSVTVQKLIGVDGELNYSSLQISSLAGEVEVYIDDKSIGTTSVGQAPLVYNAITEGSHKINLKRVSTSATYHEISKDVYFAKNVGVVGAYELGPTADSSSGYFLYAVDSDRVDGETSISINTAESEVIIAIDNQDIGTTPITNRPLNLSKQYQIKLYKDTYLPLTFTILPADQDQRSRLSGSKLIIDAHLYQIPLITNVN